MNIEQIRTEREKAENIVQSALDDFRAKTGLSITGCEIHSYSGHNLGARPITYTSRVSLEIEPL